MTGPAESPPVDRGDPTTPTESVEATARPRSAVGRRRVLAGMAVSVLAVVAAFLVGFVVAAPTEPGYSQSVALHAAVGRPLGLRHRGRARR